MTRELPPCYNINKNIFSEMHFNVTITKYNELNTNQVS